MIHLTLKMVFSLTPALALFFGIFESRRLCASVEIEVSVVRHGQPAAPQDKILLRMQDGRILIQRPVLPAAKILFLGDRQEIVMLNPDDRSYLRLDVPSLRRMNLQVEAQISSLRRELSALPPSKRSELPPHLRRLLDTSSSVLPTPRVSGKTETLQGQTCRLIEMIAQGEKRADVCFLSPPSTGPWREVWRSLLSIQNFYSKVQVPSSSPSPPDLAFGMAGTMGMMGRFEGIPLRVRRYKKGRVSSETTLTLQRHSPWPIADFQIPSSYKAEDPALMLPPAPPSASPRSP